MRGGEDVETRLNASQVLLTCREKSRDKRAAMKVDACEIQIHVRGNDGRRSAGAIDCLLNDSDALKMEAEGR